jgi:hypothetical protein
VARYNYFRPKQAFAIKKKYFFADYPKLCFSTKYVNKTFSNHH